MIRKTLEKHENEKRSEFLPQAVSEMVPHKKRQTLSGKIAYAPSLWSSERAQMWRVFACRMPPRGLRQAGTLPPDRAIVQQLVAQLPWGHILHLLHKIKDVEAREWYIRQAVEHGWSREVLSLHTAQSDYERKGQAVTNFSRTLPAPQSDLAGDVLKDPYIFDFLGLTTIPPAYQPRSHAQTCRVFAIDAASPVVTFAADHPHDGPRTWIRGRMAPRGLRPAGYFLSPCFGRAM